MEPSEDLLEAYVDECTVEVAEEVAGSGFTLQRDLTLLPTRDEKGDILNPNFTFAASIACSNCRLWIKRKIEKPTGDLDVDQIPLHHALDSLFRCASKGCHLCVYASRNSPKEPQKGRYITKYASRGSLLPHGRGLMRVLPHWHPAPDLTAANTTTMLSSIEDSLIPTAQLTASNAADIHFQYADSRLRNCLSSHPQCNHAHNGVLSPTRLIQIGSKKGSRLRLIYPGRQIEYAAVSHCWGSSKTMLLERENHDRLRDGFSGDELPVLFRDCITAARRLGISCLWIDKLCIIQDSHDDWTYEASRMADVYRGALVTLSAVSATDSQDSLFTKLHPLSLLPFYMDTGIENLALSFIRSACSQTPLYERAWVLQESLLSTRTIAYTAFGIVWQCETNKDRGGVLPLAIPNAVRSQQMEFQSRWQSLLKTRSVKDMSPYEIINWSQDWIHVLN